MHLLTVSSLFPNAVDATHGIFVERRLTRLLEHTGAKASVIAPVPWFPFKSRRFGKYAEFARIPTHDVRHGVPVQHPRFALIPRVGMSLAPAAFAAAIRRSADRVVAMHGMPDLIDAHYFYPDGVAAAALARALNRPLVITARGSDINVIGQIPGPAKRIVAAAQQSCAVVAVSEALKATMIEIGIDADRIHVLRNGVDLDFFAPLGASDREALRQELGFETTTFLSVGTLKEAKGHDIAIDAVAAMPGAALCIIGAGEQEAALRQQVQRLGIAARVRFPGRLEPEALRRYYQAADCLLLMSRREGMPNVVLESLASGTPVIAADAGGTREVVGSDRLGRITAARTPAAVIDAWQVLAAQGVDRDGVRSAALGLGWDTTIPSLAALFRKCIVGDADLSAPPEELSRSGTTA